MMRDDRPWLVTAIAEASGFSRFSDEMNANPDTYVEHVCRLRACLVGATFALCTTDDEMVSLLQDYSEAVNAEELRLIHERRPEWMPVPRPRD